MRDLMLKDEERSEKIAAMQRLVDEGLESGTGRKNKDGLFEEARARLDAASRARQWVSGSLCKPKTDM